MLVILDSGISGRFGKTGQRLARSDKIWLGTTGSSENRTSGDIRHSRIPEFRIFRELREDMEFFENPLILEMLGSGNYIAPFPIVCEL